MEREKCPRRRWLVYHQDGTGIVPARTPLPLAVGGAVHAGLASLLMNYMNPDIPREDEAVRVALAEFAKHRTGLALDAGEVAAMQPTASAQAFQSQVIAQAQELGMDPAAMGQLGADPAQAQGEFDRYLWAEQSALVEGMVRAYARRRLRPLLEQFEVLEVEREGEWLLSSWKQGWPMAPEDEHDRELWFMSRPDALLRERQTNELYLLSYKTTGAWDVRKARDIEHDMQGLSEGVEVERRLGEWWRAIHNSDLTVLSKGSFNEQMLKFLSALPAPPRIHAIRYEFLLKGERWKDKELSQRLGIDVRSQKSHLIRQYVAVSTPKKGDGGYSLGDVAWSWNYTRVEDTKTSTLAWQNWKSRPVWEEDGGVKKWIDLLDSSEILMSGEDSTIGLEPRNLGWKSQAQSMGVTDNHPLDEVFIPPVIVWRNDDDLRDWVESVEAQERRTAEAVAQVQTAGDPGERRSLLNVHFPMVRTACEYPSSCAFVKVCYAGAEMKNDPLSVGGGAFVRRIPNHPQEVASEQSPKT